MGNLIFPNVGLLQIAQSMVTSFWPTLAWGLYTNNVTLGPATTFASLSEASWTGYARQTPSGWTVNGIIANIAVSSAGSITFTNSTGSPVTAYGYFVLMASGSNLIAIEEFSGAPVTIAAGGTLSINPVIGDFSQYTA